MLKATHLWLVLCLCLVAYHCKSPYLLRQEATGDWYFSAAESTEKLQVYRRSDFSFAPSRFRERLTLSEDGTFEQTSPGPSDVPIMARGSYELKSDRLLILSLETESKDTTGHSRRYRLKEAKTDKLVLETNE